MTGTRIPLLVVLDVDSTLSNEEGIDELARAAGEDCARQVAEITDRAMCGQMDFASSLAERLDALSGAPERVIEQARSRISATEGAAELIEAVHALGGRVCAVSGGFHELIDQLMEQLDVDDWKANRLVVREGELTGERRGDLIDARAKATWLNAWAAHYGAQRVIAVGDGANDLEMMEASDLAVGFVPKPAVRDRADHIIEQRDLSKVIELLDTERV